MRPALLVSSGHALARSSVLRPTSLFQCSVSSTALARSTDASAASATQWNLAKVPHRGVLEVSGRDTVKLLQGLVSNNVATLALPKTAPSGSDLAPAMVYAGFMNPQGRMLADVFIHRQQPQEDRSPRWLLDIDSRTLPSLLSFVKKFKLRSKVKLADVSSTYHVLQAWPSTGSSSQAPSGILEKLSLDPRCPNIGYRGVLSTETSTDFGSEVNQVDSDEYTIHRIVNGVGEGALDFPEASSLPLENNLDYMHGVDFRKGCYVGQELTARTHHTGVVRKRLVPLSFYLPGTPPPTSPIDIDRSANIPLLAHLAEVRSKPIASSDSSGAAKPARGKAAGKLTAAIHNVGLACLRLEQVQRWADPSMAEVREDWLELSVLAADGETTLLVRPWIPDWWPEEPKQADQGGE